MQALCERKINKLNELAGQPGPLQSMVAELRDEWAEMQTSDYLPDAQELLNLMHRTTRLEQFYAAGQSQNLALWEQLNRDAKPLWGESNEPAFTAPQPGQVKAMIQQLVAGVELRQHDHMIINQASHFCRDAVHTLVEHCLENLDDFDCTFEDEHFQLGLIKACNNEQLNGLIDRLRDIEAWKEKLIAIRYDVAPDETRYSAQEKLDINNKLIALDPEFFKDSQERRSDALREDYTPWILTYLPTEEEAALDEMDYEDYKTLYFESCDQPWPEIDKAQLKLIEAFNKGSDLHITNNDGTDLTMSIEGHSFANSMIRRNLPGSEFFSSPVIHSINGTLVAKGKHRVGKSAVPGAKQLIEDITFNIKNGRIESWAATKGQEHLDKLIPYADSEPKYDDKGNVNAKLQGTRYFGELGFGTNPYLREQTVNGLLVEKISGSFHLAIGDSYKDGYIDDPNVKLYNGNAGPDGFHWDITTMLRGKDGEIWLDGHLMQKDGKWQAVPELGIKEEDVAVLNDGWRALPEHRRPEYWRQKIAEDDRTVTR